MGVFAPLNPCSTNLVGLIFAKCGLVAVLHRRKYSQKLIDNNKPHGGHGPIMLLLSVVITKGPVPAFSWPLVASLLAGSVLRF
jgi:hypothetical protein